MTENEDEVRVEKAHISDARILTSIQAEAFDHEADLFRIEENRGPTGYDSVESTKMAIAAGAMYKISCGNEIVGGIIVTKKGEDKARLTRIFVDPSHQGKGIGSKAVADLWKYFPEVSMWELDTPSWAVRNQNFYEKIGFVHEGHALEPISGCILYIYRMRGAGAQG